MSFATVTADATASVFSRAAAIEALSRLSNAHAHHSLRLLTSLSHY